MTIRPLYLKNLKFHKRLGWVFIFGPHISTRKVSLSMSLGVLRSACGQKMYKEDYRVY